MRIETSAPTRIDLAGGTIDIWPLYLFHPGAQTLNAAISIRARATIEPRADDRIVIRSLDTGVTVDADTLASLRDKSRLRLLSLLVQHFEATGLTLTTTSESPPGAGLAASSALTVAVCAALAEWKREHYQPETLLQIAMDVEAQALGVPTGLQDYRPALYGGIAALELEAGGARRVPLRVDLDALAARLTLCYTGEPHQSGTHNWAITKAHIDGDRGVFDAFERIRDTATRLREALERGDWSAVGASIDEEWTNRRRLSPTVTTSTIDALVATARDAGAVAAKVCGAGGGGCLFCFGPPDRKDAIKEALTRGGARLVDFRFESQGLVRG